MTRSSTPVEYTPTQVLDTLNTQSIGRSIASLERIEESMEEELKNIRQIIGELKYARDRLDTDVLKELDPGTYNKYYRGG